MTTHAKAQAHIRQLCCLGLGKEVMIPELLRALHSVIPSESNVFTGFDEKIQPAYVFPEYVISEAIDFFMSGLEWYPPETRTRFAQWLAATAS